MNGKQAKRLRKAAREMGKDMPERMAVTRRTTGEVINHPDTVRGIYRRLKNLFKKGRLNG